MTLIPTLPPWPSSGNGSNIHLVVKKLGVTANASNPVSSFYKLCPNPSLPPPFRHQHPAEATVTSWITPAPLTASPLPPVFSRDRFATCHLEASFKVPLPSCPKTFGTTGHTWETISNPRGPGPPRSILSPPAQPTPASWTLSISSTHRASALAVPTAGMLFPK